MKITPQEVIIPKFSIEDKVEVAINRGGYNTEHYWSMGKSVTHYGKVTGRKLIDGETYYKVSGLIGTWLRESSLTLRV